MKKARLILYVKRAKLADEVTLTSPGSFKVGLDFLKQLC